MARPIRIEYPGAMYHVMCRGNNGRDVFFGEDGNAISYPLPADQTSNAQLIWNAENRLSEVRDSSGTTLASYSYVKGVSPWIVD